MLGGEKNIRRLAKWGGLKRRVLSAKHDTSEREHPHRECYVNVM